MRIWARICVTLAEGLNGVVAKQVGSEGGFWPLGSIARGIALFQRRLLGLDAFALHLLSVRLVVDRKKFVNES